jgi:hypothetical protein
MATNHYQRGIRYEKEKTKSHRGSHVGGSGNPDYTRGKRIGEVKNWNRPVGKTTIRYHCKTHGTDEFVSKNGFTKDALNYVDRYRPNVNLFHRNKKIR